MRERGDDITNNARSVDIVTLIIEPYRRMPKDKPVGFVIDARTVVGEWSGVTWKDIPPRAVLYANDTRDVRPMYDAGIVEANYWKKPGYMRTLSSWKWIHSDGHPHTIYDLRGTLRRVDPVERLAAILGYVDAVRAYGGAPSSPAGMLHMLTRITAPTKFRERSGRFPGTFLWRGSRVERSKHRQTEYTACDYWDMRSAFPTALRNVMLPGHWRHVVTDTIPHVETGFARAKVDIPWMMYGPIPDLGKRHPDFPTETYVRGVWAFDELRMAQAVGCTVTVYEAWIGNAYRQPFSVWGQLVDELRATVPRAAVPVVKMAANRYVGRWAMDGWREHSRMVNGDPHWWAENGHRRPESLTVHGLVTANVRSFLFIDGIHPYPAHFIFCHTDGVALMTDETIDARPPPDDHWRVKAFMERLILLNPQRYAYMPGADDVDPEPWRYVCAGVPEEVAEPFFHRRLQKALSAVDN